jgi:hypothetical protein
MMLPPKKGLQEKVSECSCIEGNERSGKSPMPRLFCLPSPNSNLAVTATMASDKPHFSKFSSCFFPI